MKKNLIFLFLPLALALFFTACQKDQNDGADVQTNTSMDVLTAQDLIQDTEDEIDLILETRGPEQGDCPTVTITPGDGTFPRTVVIDFGTEGCEGPNGRVRKGIIQVVVTDTMINPGATRTATLIGFSVDDVQIEGTKTLENTGLNDLGQLTFTRTVADASLTFPNGDVAEWNAAHVMTRIEGADTPQRFDDVWQITGGSDGVNRQGQAFTAEITVPLVKPNACPWIVSGTRTVTVNNLSWSLDYGDGACDKIATLTRPNGTTKTVLIRRWW